MTYCILDNSWGLKIHKYMRTDMRMQNIEFQCCWIRNSMLLVHESNPCVYSREFAVALYVYFQIYRIDRVQRNIYPCRNLNKHTVILSFRRLFAIHPMNV